MTRTSCRCRVTFAIGAAVPLLLFSAGVGPASADDMAPLPGCPPCGDPGREVIPQLGPLEPLPAADDVWQDPLIPENAVDDFIVEFAPPAVVIGDMTGVIPLRPPEGAWPVEEP